MSSSPIRNVLVIGASGNVGKSTVKALLDEQFVVTGLTRMSSTAVLPASVKHAKSDYTEASLVEIFKGQDAVISTISSIVPGDALATQQAIARAAIQAEVKVFVPSEFGVDTSIREAPTFIPFLKDKVDTVDFLMTHQDKMAWISIASGSILDWGLNIPGFMGLDVSARTATIYGTGDIFYEATTLDQVGRAIAKSLVHFALTRNQFVYVNSFTVTENAVVGALERATGAKFKLSHGSVEQLWQDGADQVKAGHIMGTLAMLGGAFYGKGATANFSATKGLWNDELGLPQENLDEFVKSYVEGK